MRALLRSRWLRAFAIWTIVVGTPIALLLPTATSSLACRYGSDRTADPGLPICPPDLINVAAIYVVLLGLLWVAGVAVQVTALIALLVRRRIRDRRTTPRSAPPVQ